MSSKLNKKIDLIHKDILPPSCISILRVVVNDIDWNTGKGFKLGVNLVVEYTNLSKRTVIRCLKLMKSMFLFTLTRKHRARYCVSAMYTLNLDVLDSLVSQSKTLKMHLQTQRALEREESLRKSCGKHVNKPLLGATMAPTLGVTTAPSSFLNYHCTNTVGIQKPVDKLTFPRSKVSRNRISMRKDRLKQTEVAIKPPTREAAMIMVDFLLSCKENGIDVRNSHERYRGLVEDHYLDRLAA